MDNYAGDTPWKSRQARWTIADIKKAVHLQCRFCNGVETFSDANDCVSPSCPLFPFRPGECGAKIDGVARAKKSTGLGNLAALDRYRHKGKVV